MKLLLVLLLALPALAQKGTYWVEVETSLSGAAEVVTVHRPSNSGRPVRFVDASVYCSVACTFTVERDGTAPTTTTTAIVRSNSDDPTPLATAWKATNNVGTAGRVLAKNYVNSGNTLGVGLEDNELKAGENLTIRTSSITGTAKILIRFREY